MQTLTKQSMKAIREAVDAALVEVGKDLGVGLAVGSGSFRSNEGHFRLNVVTASPNGVVESPERKAWSLHCAGYGFTPEDLDKTFVSQGRTFKIRGIKTSRPSYPISADRMPDGKGFKFTAEQVLSALGRTVPDHVRVARRRRRMPWGDFD